MISPVAAESYNIRDTHHLQARDTSAYYTVAMSNECSMYAIMLKKGRGRVNSLVRPWKERLIVLHAETMKIAYYTVPSV